ncbi:Hypothetical protein A7982_00013 [Minicystis rosea]|nr:Hypothetical protein A7982_00013 [Minicystis rosea]
MSAEIAAALPGRDTRIAALLRTTDATAPLVVRVALGTVMFPHGAQKLLGWFGGFGFSATMGHLTGHYHLPAPIAFLVIVIESFGALALVAGAFTRVAAAGLAAVMIGAIVTSHLEHGFFMNWFGKQAGEGFEYHLLVLAMAAALMITGGGRASVDRALAPDA